MASFISNIRNIEEKQKVFVANSREANTQSLANYLPNGKLFQAKNIPNSNMRLMLNAIAGQIVRKEKTLQEVADQYYIFNTTDFIKEWELAMGIPDLCFKITGIPIEQRRKQIIAKMFADSIMTADDFVALAKFFGFDITIQAGIESVGSFPYTFPFPLAGTDKENKFTVVITFLNLPVTGAFPYTFPFTFEEGANTGFLECFIQSLHPANVKVVYRRA